MPDEPEEPRVPPPSGPWLPSQRGLVRAIEKTKGTILAQQYVEEMAPSRQKTIEDYRSMTREFCYAPADWVSPRKEGARQTGRALQAPDEEAEEGEQPGEEVASLFREADDLPDLPEEGEDEP